MEAARKPADEAQRLASLRAMHVLDTPTDSALDALTALAADVLGVPIAAVSLVDDDREWFKSAVGVTCEQGPRATAFCAHTILSDEMLIVEDAADDPRFADNPQVLEDGIRFYAGVPLLSPEGFVIGAFCVKDRRPRTLDPAQRRRLMHLAHAAERHLAACTAQAAARQARELLQGVLDSAIDGIMAFTAIRDERRTIVDFTFLEVNAAAERLTGVSAAALVGRRLLEMMPGHKADGLFDRYAQVVESGQPVAFEHWHPREGVDACFRIAASKLGDGFVVGFADITEHKRAERKLIESERRLNLALEAANEGLWEWNVQTGQAYFNDRFYRMLGYEPGDFPMDYQAWARICHPEDLPASETAFEAYFDGRTEIYQCECRVRRADGAWHWILDVGRASEYGDDGRPRKMVGVHCDIDQLKQSQIDLLEARDRAEAADRAKSQFLANMSHEIRTPMTAIVGYADLLSDPELSPTDRHNHVRTIQRNGKHLLSLINDILDLSRIESGRMPMEDLSTSIVSVVAEVLSLMRVRANENDLSLRVEYASRLPKQVRTDPMRLRQVLVNLVGNGIKFTREGGVRIVCGAHEAQGRLRISFDVLDTGIGMTADQVEKLFQPFVQADTTTTREFGGSGLGLTISRRLARALGGDIRVSSTPDVGSSFVLEVDGGPVDGVEWIDPKHEALMASPAPLTAEPDLPTVEARVLLAEDGPDNRRLIAFVLKRAGLDVEPVENGQLALDAAIEAERLGEPFDVILMDMQMPVKDGYAATSELRSLGYEGPIVALTAHAMEGDRERCIDAGCDDYATKPVDLAVLLPLIAEVMNRPRPAPA